ncbi:MAG TPA: hypothetical protein VM577_04230 [Anaerovoracaceae bacterium]|nr:hypothetical protein [Anaerovoracaceae bacterium]
MTKEEYLEYVDNFNNKRYDRVTSWFTPDITVEYFSDLANPLTATPMTLHGPDEFIASYENVHSHVRELMELGFFIEKDNCLVVELYTEFHCIKDFPQFITGPVKVGDVRIMTNWVVYDMEGGKMKRIRIAHFRMHDAKLARL